MDEPHGFTPVLAFDTAGPDFVRGVEIGRLWEMLKDEQALSEHIVHCSNAEMVLRVAEATERTLTSRELDECWMLVSFGDVGSLGREP
jgi:hypothetical protein